MIRFVPAIALIALFASLATSSEQADEPKKKPSLPVATQRTIDFDKDIKPILDSTCISCHGPAKQRGGLRLDNRDDAFKGGNSGAVVEANKTDSRLLVL